jgi:hypothetical protein
MEIGQKVDTVLRYIDATSATLRRRMDMYE